MISPLAKAPAPWNAVHSFSVQPRSARTRRLQSPGSPPPPPTPPATSDPTVSTNIGLILSTIGPVGVSECRAAPLTNHCSQSDSRRGSGP